MSKNAKVIFLLFLILYIVLGNSKVVFSSEIDFINMPIVESDRVNFQNITTEQGLSSNLITCIFQDSTGYMWIGTEDGLNRYDGGTVKVYNYESENDNSLSSTYITSIEEDKNGDIWVGTYGGLNIIDSKTNNIRRVKGDVDSDSNSSNYYITSIYKDSNDTMWVGTANGLNRYDEESRTFIKYYANNNYITDIDEHESGYLLVSTRCGIELMNINKLDTYTKDFNVDNSAEIYSVDIDNDGNIWILAKGTIFKYDKISDKSSSYNISIGENKVISISSILCDEQDNTWLASTEGLIKYDKKNNVSKRYERDRNNLNSLTSNLINYLYEDRNGMLWIGTDNGISILNTIQPFKNRINEVLISNNIDNSSITSIIEDSNNDIWIGTKGNGIINFIVETDEIVRYLHTENDEKTLSSNVINEILELRTGEIMVSTYSGVDMIYKDTGEVVRKSENDLTKKYVNETLKTLNDGKYIWCGTNEGFFRGKDSPINSINYNNNFDEMGVKSYRVIDIFQDESDDNILWLAGGVYSGLIKFHKTEGVIKNYVSDSSVNSISYDTINCIVGDGKGNLWIGTSSGLNKFNIESETFISYSKKDGLSSDYINGIVIDDNENLWIATNNGLTKFNIKNNKFINFTEIDGIRGTNFNRGANVKLEGGQILFGTTNGIVAFNPDEISEETYIKNKVVIGKVRVNDKLINYNEDNIEFKYNENNLNFQYFMPNYSRLGEVSYLYKLEGVDNKWKYVDNIQYANYTLLEPGHYVFKVRAMDSNSNITEEAKLEFTIKSPLWKSKRAYYFYFIVILGITICICNYVKILKAMVKKQTKEINCQMEENKKLYERSIKNEKFKNDYFVNLSHELRTPINIILSALQLINSLDKSGDITKEKAKHYMGVIKKSSNNLLKIIGDIIDSSKIESGTYKINKQENVDIIYLVEETALNMSNYISAKDIELIIDPEVEEKMICCDPNEIERCVINLIGNSVKFTEEGGKITVVIKDDDNSVSISIEDNGLGISKDDQEFIFKRFEQGKNSNSTKVSSSGIGLTLVKYIIELHNGSVALESELNKGSKFTIVLPVK